MRILTIEKDGYRLECAPQDGAILRSLTWCGLDLLRPSQNGCSDPLGSAMFPLVPFSNRLGEDVAINGEDVRLPRYLGDCDLAIHGFGWKKQWEVAEQTETSVEMVLHDADSPWPAPYRAQQHLSFDRDGFHAKLTITNTGSVALPAGIGFHPYFPRADCLMTIDLKTRWHKDSRDLPLKPNGLDWTRFDHVALANLRLDHSFSGWNGIAQLRWPDRNLAIELSTNEVLRELVIYSPDEDFFCLEPVSHLTNAMFAKDVEKRSGWRTLDPGESLSGSFNLRARRIA